MDLNKPVLIIGNGAYAWDLVQVLSAVELDIILTSQERPSENACNAKDFDFPTVEFLHLTRLISCSGFSGDFQLRMEKGGTAINRTVSQIVISEDYHRQPNTDLYGLRPTPNVLALSELIDSKKETIKAKKLANGKTVAFLTGLLKESNPLIFEDILRVAKEMQSLFHQKIFIFTQNLKVAENGLEAFLKMVKDRGVFIKSTDTLPTIQQSQTGDVQIRFFDEISRQSFQLTPDMTIVDETLLPSDNLKQMAKIFNLETDATGFIQADNVHRYPIYTNREGIMAVGPSRGIFSASTAFKDIGNVVNQILVHSEGLVAPENTVEIRRGRCVKCLTCYRLCPHGAIKLHIGVSVMNNSCQCCGICVSECPKHAIQFTRPFETDMSLLIKEDRSVSNGTHFQPTIVLYCCRRSAPVLKNGDTGWDSAEIEKLIHVEVPCGGSISTHYILAAFKAGADGVLILTCHEGNCYSECGNSVIRRKVDHLRDLLPQMGINKERVRVQALAANMESEYRRIIRSFEDTLIPLGPTITAAHKNGDAGSR